MPKYGFSLTQFVIFKPLRYCFEETIAFDVKASLASGPGWRVIRWYSKPGDITKEFWGKAIQFHGTFYGLKITNWTCIFPYKDRNQHSVIFHTAVSIDYTYYKKVFYNPIKFSLSSICFCSFLYKLCEVKRLEGIWIKGVFR